MNINNMTTMYAGESKNLVVTVYDENGKELNITGATFVWKLDTRKVSIVKDSASGDIVNTNPTLGEVTISLKPSDTENLSGTYYHELKMTDQNGNESVVIYDYFRILRALDM